jgi:hypothetical protein
MADSKVGEGRSVGKVAARLYCMSANIGGEGKASDDFREATAARGTDRLLKRAAVIDCLRKRASSSALNFWRASSATDPPLAQTEGLLGCGGLMSQFEEVLDKEAR